MKKGLLYLACLTAACAPMSAFANAAASDYTFENGSFGAQTGVHFLSQGNANTVYGTVNQDGSGVTFTSSNAITSGGGAGEATITGSMANLTVFFEKAWDNITFAFSNDAPSDFTMLVNNDALFNASNCGICSLKKNSNNQFTLSGTSIQSLVFNFDPAIATAKQFRVEGVSAISSGNFGDVPEPATWAMMIIGFGAIGGVMRTRRRASAAIAA